MSENKNKILIIEDEQDIREAIVAVLEDQFTVLTAATGLTGLKEAIRNKPDLIVLDLNLPDLDGYQVCKSLREDSDFKTIPIIILTAFNESNDRVRAFDMGADDYLAKPFSNVELVARINRKLNVVKDMFNSLDRKIDIIENDTLLCGNLKLNAKNQSVILGEQSIHLSSIEFKLMRLFIENKGQLLSRQRIIENVWESQSVSERVIDPHIVSLRNKLSDFDHTISSIYRGGYILK